MPSGKVLKLRHPPSLAEVTVHKPVPLRKVFIFGAFLALHSVGMKACWDTSGDAYEIAVARVRKINREHHLNGTKSEDMPPQDPLPSTWAPNAWASAGLFCSLSLHAFFYLLCHWKVKFRSWVLYSAANRVTDGCYMQVIPPPHRGQADMVPVHLPEESDRLAFIFQRQRYEYIEPEDDEETGQVTLVKCPVDLSLETYFKGRGLRPYQVEESKEHFGPNMLEVEMPTFLQCYQEQMLTPLVIFQIFVALLWAADDFVNYTLMQLVFILMFESTTVFQRLKTMKMLNSMGTKSYGVKAFRGNDWTEVSTADLVPGDIIELTAVPPPAKSVSKQASNKEGSENQKPPELNNVSIDIVPCDCVVLRGEAVVSEASLTGESAPQMKDALVLMDRTLDIQGADRVHSLFSGTRLLRASDGRRGGQVAPEVEPGGIPAGPDGGCLCYVVRTGFASSQGELLQMIEFSQEKVAGDTKEVMIALLILLGFALVAAGYVLKVGLEKGEKTPHELLIKCVIILTAVVPRQLPMQMAVAVNTALMTLTRSGVYCTEPYRVPIAGKLTHCFFDKTGTLTTDTLVPVSVVNVDGKITPGAKFPDQSKVIDAEPVAALVLSTCHALVSVEGRLSGDPIEVAALEGVGWAYDADDEVASPASLLSKIDNTSRDAGDTKGKDVARPKQNNIKQATVLHRFHFASHLQRMAVIAEVDVTDGKKGDNKSQLTSGKYALVKGSPEALKNLLAEGAEPSWFDEGYLSLSEAGLRVLALAYRPLTADEAATAGHALVREDIEKDLFFVGFIAFECKARNDSGLVLGALRESDHTVAMLTGDAPLTALHIARTCGIVDAEKPGLQLRFCSGHGFQESEGGSPGGSPSGSPREMRVEWVVATGEKRGDVVPLACNLLELAKKYSLIATGQALDAAVTNIPELWKTVDEIRVFARMTPQGKATVIRELQNQGSHVLMCGDGGNDVGALKQADVGLALLAGYGNVNTSQVATTEVADVDQPAKSSEEALNEQQAALAKRGKDAQKARQAFLWAKQKELNGMHQQWLQEEIDKKAREGQTGIMVQASAVKVVIGRISEELKKEMREYDKKHGNVYDAGDGKKDENKDPAEKLKEQLASMDDAQGIPMVRPGDASVAAPFTSKAPSVKNCVDLIRQGRCTLLSALQQQQIMMLNCIINAYVLSALSMEGSRSSERQLMASNWLLTIASLAFAYASPVDRMHPVRPLRSLFNPAVFISMLGQSAIHLACMISAVRMCRSAMEEGSPERLAGWEGPSFKDITEFWRIEKLKRKGVIETDEEQDWTQMAMQLWFKPFLPNLMNTVVFLVETAQTVAILFVNYKGQPWMKGIMENRALFLSVFIAAGGVAAAAWEFLPDLNILIHLSPFPNDSFRWRVMALVAITLVGTFIWDRICVMIFAPEIFRSMVDSAKKTTFMGDIFPVFKTAGKVIGVLVLLGTGNILLIGGAIWWYRKANKDA